MMARTAFFIRSIFLASALLSQTPLGHTQAVDALPDQFSGSAKLTLFGFDIYNASLWVGKGFERDHYAKHPLTLELTYLRSFKGSAIANQSLKEMRRVESFSEAQGDIWLAALTKVIPDVKKGDRLMGLYQPGKGLRLMFNGASLPPLTEVPDPTLARIFTGIWLSPNTSAPAMRELILGGPTK
jgi:hypothetical protein